MILKKMILNNFKMFDELTLDFDEKTVFVGDNKVGKTTIVDAYYWALLGRSSLGVAEFDFVKPVRNGEAVHNVVTSVTLEFDEVTICREIEEKYTKNGDLKGHKGYYFIDGKNYSKTEFDARVSIDICEQNLFSILSDVFAFDRLTGIERRNFLLQDNEGIRNLSVEINTDKDKISKKREDVKELAIRIAEQEGSFVELKPLPDSEITAKIKTIDEKIETVRQEKEKIRDKIEDMRDDLTKKRKKYESSKRAKVKELREKIEQIQNEVSKKDMELNLKRDSAIKEKDELVKKLETAKHKNELAENNSDNLKSKIKYLEADLWELREKYKKLKKKSEAKDSTCPMCGQTMPKTPETIAADKEALQELSSRGKELSKEIEELKKELNEITITGVSELQKQIDNFVIPEFVESGTPDEAISIYSQIDALEGVDFDESPVAMELQDNINALKMTLNIEPEEFENEKRELLVKLDEIKEHNTKVEMSKRTKDRIAELKTELEELNSKIEEMESHISKNEDALLAQIEDVEDEVNSKFNIVKWKLFDIHLNGNVEPVCVATVDGIEYKLLNNAMKINVGIDFINAISKEKNKKLPLFIDNAESSTDILESNGQTILLYVKEGEKLRRMDEKISGSRRTTKKAKTKN